MGVLVPQKLVLQSSSFVGIILAEDCVCELPSLR